MLFFALVTKSLKLAVYLCFSYVICRAIDCLLHALLRGSLKIDPLPYLFLKPPYLI